MTENMGKNRIKGGSTTKAEDEPEAKGRIRQDEIRGQPVGKMIPKATRRG